MKIYIETYGCTANKSDESTIKGILKNSDNQIINNIRDADFLLILTCTVIGTTEQRMLSRLKEFKKYDKKVIVAGCMPVVQSELIKSIIPDAFLISPNEIKNIGLIVNGSYSKIKVISEKKFDDTIAPISISKGCIFSCSYCITHLARGELNSIPKKDIIKDIISATNQGCKEIQLTAQDTAAYGFDNGNNLGSLLEEICKIKRDFRIRVGMMNPSTLQKNLDLIIKSFKNEKIYKFLHLPVQSGDDDILKLMDRKYSVNDFKDIVKKFKKNFKNLTLATDIIVGFPSEDEKQFENSIKLVNEIKPDIVNITKFSARPYTLAKNMKNRISTDIVKKRSKFLTDYCKRILSEINKNYVGQEFNILITEQGKNKTYSGRTINYKPVVLKENVTIGNYYDVEIIGSAPTYLYGKLI